MFQLAAAEAEAEALRKELAARKGSSGPTDLSKLKPATPEKRIDGTGYRETLFSGPGNTTGMYLPCIPRRLPIIFVKPCLKLLMACTISEAECAKVIDLNG